MAYNYNYNAYPQQNPAWAIAQQRSVLNQVYLWMTGGLCLTGLVAAFVASSAPARNLILGNPIVFFVLLIAELGVVFALSGWVGRMSAATATFMFLAYAFLNGLTLSVFFMVYTYESIAATLFVTAGMFGIMSLYGYTTKRDLTTVGNIAFMGLIGIILASIVNWFLHSSALYWMITYIGIAVFIGLTVYDTQKIKRMSMMVNEADTQSVQRFAIIGALTLYLDFINLFLLLLRIFGRRR